MSSVAFVAFLLASIAPDIVDVLYVVAGICSPFGLYSHTLLAVALEAAIIGGVALLATGSRSVTIAFVVIVLLHLPADYFTGRKLFMPGGELFGLRWYDRPLFDWLLEVPVAATGWWVLRRSQRAPHWAQTAWALILVLTMQTTFDLLGSITRSGFKPNACPIVSVPVALPAPDANQQR